MIGGLHAPVPVVDRVHARHRLTPETQAVPRPDRRTRDGAVVAVDAVIDRGAADRLARTAEAWGLAVLGHEITDVNRQWKETHA